MTRGAERETDHADSEMIGSILLISLMAAVMAIVLVVLVSQPFAEKIPDINPNITMYASPSGTSYLIITHRGGDSLSQGSSTIWNSDGIVEPSRITLQMPDGSESPWPGRTWVVGSALLVPSGSSDPGTVGVVYKGGTGQHLLFRQGAGPGGTQSLKAQFRFSPDPAVVSQEVMFSDYSSGGPTGWSWNFGDGGTSDMQNPSHVFQGTGTYTVTLIAANTAGSDVTARQVTVYAVPIPPQVSFTAEPLSGTAPLQVRFTDTSTGTPTGWSWNFGDSGTSDVQNPLHVFLNAGTYTVVLTATNAYGSGTATRTITVAPCTLPQASFTPSTQSGDAPLAVWFTDASTGSPSEWSWEFGDGGTSTGRNSSHVFTSAGIFRVNLTVSNPCGQTSSGRDITVKCPRPQSNFTFSPQSGDAPLTIRFTDTSTGTPTGWSWEFGDGGRSTDQNPSHVFTSAGTYTVNLTVSGQCGQASSTRTVPVSSCPSPQSLFTFSPQSGNAPLTVQFTDTSTGSPTGWSWNFGDGGTSTGQNPSHVFASAGQYTVNLTVSNSCSQSTSAQTIPVSQCPSPQSLFTFSPQTGNAPLTVQFTDTSTGSPTGWSWNFGDGRTSTSQNPSHVFTSEGTYTVNLTVSNSCGQSASSKQVVAHPAIAASFTFSPQTGPAPLSVQFTDTSTGSPTGWSWNFGDGGSSSIQNPSHTFASPGTYTVTLTTGNAYSSGTATHTVTVTLQPGGNVYLNTEKVGYIESGGYMQFRVTGGNPSYINIGNTRITFRNGDTVKLVVGSDGSGKIYISSGMISTFQFNGVSLYVNGVHVVTGNVNEIYVGNHDSYVSTMTITTNPQTKWTDLEINANRVIYGESSALIRVVDIGPNSDGTLNLDTLSPGSSKVYFVGSATGVTY